MSFKSQLWKTRYGFYLAAIGSALGLGNLWRFPFIVGENGGGAFILLYIFMSVLIGLPLLIGELVLGRHTRKSTLASVKLLKLYRSPYKWIARLSVAVCLFILSYFAVISGWVLHYTVQFFVSIFQPSTLNQVSTFSVLMSKGWLQVALTSVHLLFSLIIVLKGVQEGIEKWSTYLMPFLILIVGIILFQTLSLPSSKEAMKFLFYPDFSSLKLNSLGSAIGHVFFTLSVGLGTMITFGSYMKESDHIPTAGFRVASLDIILSLLGAMIVFPIAILATDVPLTDPGLLFEVLPKFFSRMTGGSYFGFLFFLCLYIAALAASITLMEVVSTNLTQKKEDKKSAKSSLSFLNRHKSAIIVFVIALLISLFPSMSSSFLSSITLNEKSLLQIIDMILVEFLLPLIAIAFCFIITKGISEIDKERLFVDQRKIESQSLFPYWKFAIKYFIPVVVATGITLSAIGFFI